jgi:hypothetical protein
MALNRTESRNDMLTINGFRVEINNQIFQNFTTVGGLTRTAATLENRDGGSGLAEYFSDQTLTMGPISATYRVDPSTNEWDRLRKIIDDSIFNNVRHSFVVIKYNHGKEYKRFVCYKTLFNTENLPDLDKNGSGPFDVSLEAAISGWEIL